MALVDAAFWPILVLLRDMLADAVADLTTPPAAVEHRYGNEVAFDLSQNEDVCCQGLAWVRLGVVTPGFPEADSGVRNCSIPIWSAAIELGIVRCAPMGDAENITTGAEHAAAAAALAEDFMALRHVVCLFAGAGYEYTVGPWTPVGPAGGCMGSTITLNVGVIPLDSYP